MPINIGNKKSKLYLGNTKVLKAYLGSAKIYSSGNVATYYVDEDAVYREEIEEGKSCLEPKTFIIPKKNGYLFAGWSLESGGEVLESIIMGDEPITLYAVFQDANVMKNPKYVTYTGMTGTDQEDGTYRFAIMGYNNYPENAWDVTGTGSISINLNGHKKAIIVLQPSSINTASWWEDQHLMARCYINDSLVYDTSSQLLHESRELTYTFNTDATLNYKLNVKVNPSLLENPDFTTFVYGFLSVKSIILSDE